MRVNTDVCKQAVQVGRFDLELLDGCGARDELPARRTSAALAFPDTGCVSDFCLFLVTVTANHVM